MHTNSNKNCEHYSLSRPLFVFFTLSPALSVCTVHPVCACVRLSALCLHIEIDVCHC